MTVRINKSAFNIREKLSELERPIGVKGNELMRAETAQDARDLVSAGRKNLVINGDMKIHQRNNGTLTPTNDNSQYSVDRWIARLSQSSKYTLQQSTVNPGQGFTHSLLATSTSSYSIAAGDFFGFATYIEGYNSAQLGWGTSSAKSATLSFWVRSSIAGKFSGAFWSYVGGGNPSLSFEYNIDSTNTWEYKTIVIPPITTGSWNTGNSGGIVVYFSLGVGTTYSDSTPGTWGTSATNGTSSSVSIVSTSGATIYLTGCQLEVGKNATDFEHRSYGEELALCQRYYQRNKLDSGQYAAFVSGTAYSAGTFYGTYHLQTPMRTSPTSMGYSNLSHFSIVQTNTTNNPNPNAFGIDNGSGTQTLRLYATTSGNTGLTPGYGSWIQTNNTSAYIDFSAEL